MTFLCLKQSYHPSSLVPLVVAQEAGG